MPRIFPYTRSLGLIAVIFLSLFYLRQHCLAPEDPTARTSPTNESSVRLPARLNVETIEDSEFFERVPTTTRREDFPRPTDAPNDTILKLALPICRSLVDANNVVLMIKTSASDVYTSLPHQLLMLSYCVPKIMIFSDFEQSLGRYYIHDALKEVDAQYKDYHEDFALYRSLQANYTLSGVAALPNGLGKSSGLDRWKYIPMLHKARATYPTAKWFVGIEANTFLGWANLLAVLNQTNPDQPLYVGSLFTEDGGLEVPQPGPGFAISRAAMEKFESVYDAEHVSVWEADTSQSGRDGHYMLATALKSVGVEASDAYPMFQNDTLLELTWTADLWCKPAVSWQGVGPHELEALWHFEQTWIRREMRQPVFERKGPYLYRDLFRHFVQPYLDHSKENWNNLAEDRVFTEPGKDQDDDKNHIIWEGWDDFQRSSVTSVDKCVEVCESDPECMMWSWETGTCRHHHSIRLGHQVDPDVKMVSGWLMNRVDEFRWRQEMCEGLADWLRFHPATIKGG